MAAACTRSSTERTASSISTLSLSQTTAIWCSLALSSQASRLLLHLGHNLQRTGSLYQMKLRSKTLRRKDSLQSHFLQFLPRLEIIQSCRYRALRVLYFRSRSRHRLTYMLWLRALMDIMSGSQKVFQSCAYMQDARFCLTSATSLCSM